MQWMSKPRWLASTGLLAALVSVAVVPAVPAAAAAIPGPGAAAPAPVTAISISQCVKSVGSDHLTVAQAERCTANAPVYASASPPKRPLTGAYVITKDGMAVIVRSVTNSARAVSSGSRVVPTGCWWSLTSGSVSWWGGDNGGSYTAWGDGNHCGYGDITATSPGPATVAWCVCTGMSWSMGSYDSSYGSSHFGYPYAAVWANGALSTGPVHWDNYIRLYHNSSGNWWSSISLG
jgi:hypothetical protein